MAPSRFNLVYLGAPIMAGQIHTVAWGYLASGPLRAPHVVFSTSSGGDNDVKGPKTFADALRAKRIEVRSLIDMKPQTVDAKLAQVIAAAK